MLLKYVCLSVTSWRFDDFHFLWIFFFWKSRVIFFLFVEKRRKKEREVKRAHSMDLKTGKMIIPESLMKYCKCDKSPWYKLKHVLIRISSGLLSPFTPGRNVLSILALFHLLLWYEVWAFANNYIQSSVSVLSIMHASSFFMIPWIIGIWITTKSYFRATPILKDMQNHNFIVLGIEEKMFPATHVEELVDSFQ